MEKKTKILSFIILIVVFGIFILHSLCFGKWIIDDAGISFAYSKNLASGYGLVSQPGISPVEGYSNPLWVFLISIFFLLNIFDPVVTSKVIGLVFILGAFFFIYKSFTKTSEYNLILLFFILLTISLSTSITVWSVSGLENPLYAFLGVVTMFFSFKYFISNKKTKGISFIIGLSTGLLSITRPDGLIYVAVFPLLLFWLEKKRQSWLSSLIFYFSGFTLVFGSHLIFRIIYFEDILPNTYYVKGAYELSLYKIAGKLKALNDSLAGWFGNGIALFVFITFIYLAKKKKLSESIKVVFTFCVISFTAYIIMPRDWMGESRFATLYYFYFIILFFMLAKSLYDTISWKNETKKKLIITTITVFFFLSMFYIHWKRTESFKTRLPAPFQVVKDYISTFDRYAKKLDKENLSALIPDVGAAIYYSKLRIYDIPGLTDKTIAKTFQKDMKKFYDYVFEKIKPTFIHTHMSWTYSANYDSDPRFRRDYTPIEEHVDRWVKDKYGKTMYSGDYIRKDVLGNKSVDFLKK